MLLWRFLRILLFSRFFSKLDFFAQSKTSFRVCPTDLDILLHMNNGKYFSLMDMARFDFIIRSQKLPLFKKHGIYTVIASEMMRFRKSLKLFRRFEITTQIAGWDDKYIYLEQFFLRKGKIYAFGLVKIRCKRKTGVVDTAELFQLLGINQPSPQLPQWIHDWQSAEQLFFTNKQS